MARTLIKNGSLVKGAGGDPKKAKIAVFQGTELMTAALGGHVDCVVTVASNILPHVESGKLRMPGVAAPRRQELGLDLVASDWAGVFGVKGMRPPQIAYWDGVLAASVASADWKAFLAANQWDAEYLNSADYTKFLRAEDAKLRSALTDLGLAK